MQANQIIRVCMFFIWHPNILMCAFWYFPIQIFHFFRNHKSQYEWTELHEPNQTRTFETVKSCAAVFESVQTLPERVVLKCLNLQTLPDKNCCSCLSCDVLWMMVSVGYFHSEVLDKLHVLGVLPEDVDGGVEIIVTSTPVAVFLVYLTTLLTAVFCFRAGCASTTSGRSPTVKQPVVPSFAVVNKQHNGSQIVRNSEQLKTGMQQPRYQVTCLIA